MADDIPTSDDTRRVLEALGLTRGGDRSAMTRAALDAYSEIWMASPMRQMDHEHALQAAIAVAVPFFLGER